MAADYSRIHRLLKIMTLVQGDPSWTVARLALECGKSERTVYRDIRMLIAAGIPIHFDEESKAYSIQRDFFMKSLELTLEESLAMLALAKYIGQDEQVPFTKPAVQAMAKVRNQLPLKIQKALDDLDQHMAVALAKAGPHDGCKDVYDRVQNAISKRLALKCRYESPSGQGRANKSFLLKP